MKRILVLLLITGIAVGGLFGPRGSAAEVTVYKSATCGCCTGWVEHLKANGFTVESKNVDNLAAIKTERGVPPELASCHTALVGDYVVEGHVPAEQVRRLLAERPAVAGIAVPGMPMGSPGMEGPTKQPYAVLSFDDLGRSDVYARYK